MKAGEHLAAVFGFGQLVFEAARVQGDDGGSDTEFVSVPFMGVFGIVGLVCECAVEGNVLGGLGRGRFEERHVVTRAAGHDDACEQVGFRMTHNREFGPVPLREGTRPIATVEVVGAGVARFEAGGVDSAFRPFVYETERVGTLEYCSRQRVQSPFLSSRFSA